MRGRNDFNDAVAYQLGAIPLLPLQPKLDVLSVLSRDDDGTFRLIGNMSTLCKEGECKTFLADVLANRMADYFDPPRMVGNFHSSRKMPRTGFIAKFLALLGASVYTLHMDIIDLRRDSIKLEAFQKLVEGFSPDMDHPFLQDIKTRSVVKLFVVREVVKAKQIDIRHQSNKSAYERLTASAPPVSDGAANVDKLLSVAFDGWWVTYTRGGERTKIQPSKFARVAKEAMPGNNIDKDSLGEKDEAIPVGAEMQEKLKEVLDEIKTMGSTDSLISFIKEEGFTDFDVPFDPNRILCLTRKRPPPGEHHVYFFHPDGMSCILGVRVEHSIVVVKEGSNVVYVLKLMEEEWKQVWKDTRMEFCVPHLLTRTSLEEARQGTMQVVENQIKPVDDATSTPLTGQQIDTPSDHHSTSSPSPAIQDMSSSSNRDYTLPVVVQETKSSSDDLYEPQIPLEVNNLELLSNLPKDVLSSPGVGSSSTGQAMYDNGTTSAEVEVSPISAALPHAVDAVEETGVLEDAERLEQMCITTSDDACNEKKNLTVVVLFDGGISEIAEWHVKNPQARDTDEGGES